MQLHQLLATLLAVFGRREARLQRGFAALLCFSTILAMYGDRATAQSQPFTSYYGTDASHAFSDTAIEYSRVDPPYQSHFGTSRPVGHQVSRPSGVSGGMDADSLYAASVSQQRSLPQYFGPPPVMQASAQAFAPYVYYIVTDAEGGAQQTPTSPPERFASLAPGAQWQFAQFEQDESEDVTAPPRVSDGTGEDGDTPTFGQQQEQIVGQIEESPLAFLRSQSVLLDPGERQIDVGMEYAVVDGFVFNVGADASPPAGDNVTLTFRARQRLLLCPLTWRYGLSENVQVFQNIPFGWSNSEFALSGTAPPAFDEWSNRAGIGDVNTGATMLVWDGCGDGPTVLATFAFTAPTGDADFFVAGAVPNSRLGEGFWAVSSQLLVTQTLDPCVLFYGIGYRHRFDGTFAAGPGIPGRIRVNPGEQFIYQLGLGFAANESVTFSSSFVGSYVTEDQINGRRVYGAISEPMRMRFAATIAKPCKIVEPFAEIGMTRDAAGSHFGITWTY